MYESIDPLKVTHFNERGGGGRISAVVIWLSRPQQKGYTFA